jgi:anti-anti-sigma regulatory factor
VPPKRPRPAPRHRSATLEDAESGKAYSGRVRASGLLQPEATHGASDHACWAYASDEERAHVAATWLADGIGQGQLAMYVADGGADDLETELRAAGGLEPAFTAGQVVVRATTDVYDLSGPIQADQQLAAYDHAVQEALAGGFTGLRVAADITPLVRDLERRPSHLAWEQVGDRYITTHPFAPVCLYDRREIDGWDAIDAVHPLHGPRDRPFWLTATDNDTVRLAGELDALSAECFREALAALPETDRWLDTSELRFADARTATMLAAEVTRRRATGQPLAVTGLPAGLRRVLELCDIDPASLQ